VNSASVAGTSTQQVQKHSERCIVVLGNDQQVRVSKTPNVSHSSSLKSITAPEKAGNTTVIDGVVMEVNAGQPCLVARDCSWISAATTGTTLATFVISPPCGIEKLGALKGNTITMDAFAFVKWVKKPIGVRLRSSLTPEEKHLLLAVSASVQPILLRDTESTLDTSRA